MGLFSTRKPRGYHHQYIYYDERKEKLKRIEEKAKREQLKEAKKIAKQEERSRDRATTTVEKIRQYEADYKKSEEQAAEDRKQRELLLNERNKEAIESALSIEEHRNNEIERLHDFYDVTTDKNHQTTIKINNYKLIFK